jgi:sarcosine oxidase
MGDNLFDVIVLGVGGMGSAAAYELARRGRRVLGLEQFALGHDRGSSHGHTRIIRKAYYEHPDYVPLVLRAYERWRDLEGRRGRALLTECPCLSVGHSGGELVAGVLRSAAEHGLPVERLGPAEIRRRFPMFRFDDEHVGVLEHSAGFLYVDDCVRAHAEEARKLGAVIRDGDPALSWKAERGGVTVETAAGRYSAGRLVITAGPWAGRLLGELGARLQVMRQVVFWFGPHGACLSQKDGFPIFIAETPGGDYYGLPALNADGVKVARHYGAPELREPSEIVREVSADDEPPVRRFLQAHLPAADGPVRRASVCVYTLTPDRHFLIDVHPAHPQVVFAAGFSGHGFKFSSVVGEILADLAETGRTERPIGLFRLRGFENRGDTADPARGEPRAY